jgi:hypothetical protein
LKPSWQNTVKPRGSATLVARSNHPAGSAIAGVSRRISGVIVNAGMYDQGTAIGVKN